MKVEKNRLDQITLFLAEVLGTGFLLFLGCMGCVTTMGGQNNALQISVSFGLTVMMIVQIFGCVSGAHLNPAVTTAAYIYNLMSLPTAAIYIAGQMIGAFFGFGLLKIVTPEDAFFANNSTIGLCTTSLNPQISPAQGLLVEFIITTTLIWIVCSIWDPRNAQLTDSFPLKIGLFITAISLAAGPWTGASMNPARSLAPAIWNSNFENHWVYWVGPMAAGILGALSYKMVFRREMPSEKSRIAEEFTTLSSE